MQVICANGTFLTSSYEHGGECERLTYAKFVKSEAEAEAAAAVQPWTAGGSTGGALTPAQYAAASQGGPVALPVPAAAADTSSSSGNGNGGSGGEVLAGSLGSNSGIGGSGNSNNSSSNSGTGVSGSTGGSSGVRLDAEDDGR